MSNKNILVDFSNIANAVIDKTKKGDRIDRKAIIEAAKKKLGTECFTDMNASDMLTVLCRGRSSDLEVRKGKTGGTFKK